MVPDIFPFHEYWPGQEKEAALLAEKARQAALRSKTKRKLENKAGLHTLGPELEKNLWSQFYMAAENLSPGSTVEAPAGHKPTAAIQNNTVGEYPEMLIPDDLEFQSERVSAKDIAAYEEALGTYSLGQGHDKITPKFITHVGLLSNIRHKTESGEYKLQPRSLKEICSHLIGLERGRIAYIMYLQENILSFEQAPEDYFRKAPQYIKNEVQSVKQGIQELKDAIERIKTKDLETVAAIIQKYLRADLDMLASLGYTGKLFEEMTKGSLKIGKTILVRYETMAAQLLADLDTVKELKKHSPN